VISTVALVLEVAFVAVAFGWRSWVQYRRTGDAGFRAFSRNASGLERVAGVLFVAGTVACLLAPLAGVLGWLPTSPATAVARRLGLTLMVGGFAVTIAAQLQMGDSWRIGVDPGERTGLVDRGLFAWVRNPIFSGMLLGSLGLMLAVPGFLSFTGFLMLAAAVEMQVRRIEEPYLLGAHGDAYRVYARRVGRFVPGVGRLA
jgi:protein-S-isoprenylcysteine O-methyltransferase Ste14